MAGRLQPVRDARTGHLEPGRVVGQGNLACTVTVTVPATPSASSKRPWPRSRCSWAFRGCTTSPPDDRGDRHAHVRHRLRAVLQERRLRRLGGRQAARSTSGSAATRSATASSSPATPSTSAAPTTRYARRGHRHGPTPRALCPPISRHPRSPPRTAPCPVATPPSADRARDLPPIQLHRALPLPHRHQQRLPDRGLATTT